MQTWAIEISKWAMENLQEGLLGGAEDLGKESFQELKASLASITQAWLKKTNKKAGGQQEARAPWRRKLAQVLESTAFHGFILALLLLDLLATVVDVLHTLSSDSHDLSHCISMLQSCQCTSQFEVSESWDFLYWIGISVLCILALNILGLLVALGFSFFTHPGYVLDLVVVVTALCLEIFLDSETAGLLVILNLWRIVRVAHGIFEVTDEAWEREVQKLEEQVQAVEAAHQQDLRMVQRKQQRIAELEAQLLAAQSAQQDNAGFTE